MMPDDAGSAPAANAGPPWQGPESATLGPTSPEPPQSAPPSTSGRHGRTWPWTLPRRPDRVRTASTGQHGARQSFRVWRRSRPFWGGLLLIIAGIELILIPLSGVLVKGAIKLVIYIGIGGVFGVLIGALLVAAGLVLWFNPTHRVFYGIAGIVLGILSFPASNLGGFFIGMLLAILGGALGFAWTPAEDAPAPRPAPGDYHDEDSGAVPGRPEDDAPTMGLDLFDGPEGNGTRNRDNTRGHSGHRGGASAHRMLAVTAMPAVMVAGMLGTSAAAKNVSAPQSRSGCVLLIFCSPGGGSSPSPSPTATPSSGSSSPASPSPTSTSGPLPLPPVGVPTVPGQPNPSSSATSGSGGGNGSGSGGKSGKSGKNNKKKAKKAKQGDAPGGLVASSATSVLTAGSASLSDFNFVQNTYVPTSPGASCGTTGGSGCQEMMEFTASSATLSGNVKVAVTTSSGTSTTTSPSLDFSGDMTLYATKLCGDIEAIPLQVCFTPTTVSALLLKIANLATGTILNPITMTNVTTDQPLTTAGALQTGKLNVAS
jgi:hypothetical protein